MLVKGAPGSKCNFEKEINCMSLIEIWHTFEALMGRYGCILEGSIKYRSTMVQRMAWGEEAISWTISDQDLWKHMTWLGYKELQAPSEKHCISDNDNQQIYYHDHWHFIQTFFLQNKHPDYITSQPYVASLICSQKWMCMTEHFDGLIPQRCNSSAFTTKAWTHCLLGDVAEISNG